MYSNIHNSSKVDVAVGIGPSDLLSCMAKSWWESSIGDRDPLCITSLDKPENNLECVVSSFEDTNNSIQRTIVRKVFTTSNLSCYPMNSSYLLFQKAIPRGSRDMEYSILFHESELTMYQDYAIDNRISFPGTAVVGLGLVAGTH